jgi:hypothetical protein
MSANSCHFSSPKKYVYIHIYNYNQLSEETYKVDRPSIVIVYKRKLKVTNLYLVIKLQLVSVRNRI